MSGKIVCIIIFVTALAYAKAEGNGLCPCDATDNTEQKKMLNLLLEKLSSNVNKDEEILYSVYPGLLNEFSCDCAEKQRRKRKIMPDQPEEVIIEEVSDSDLDATKEPVKKRYIHKQDRRCPEGFYRFARGCFRAEHFDDYN